MYADRSGSGSGGIKRSIKDRLGDGSSTQLQLLNRQRTDNAKRTPNVSALKGATLQNNLAGRSENATRSCIREMQEKISSMSKTQVTNEGSLMISNIDAIFKRQRTNTGPIGVSVVKETSTARPKKNNSLNAKSAAGTVSAKKSLIQSGPPVSTEQKQQGVVKPEESDAISFLQSLGLNKYAITFKAEEIDMFALRHMNDHDLKEIGLPMGPRKKILLGLASANSKK